nr:MAG TPA: hypothetical protein [Caudoviricetes sp.]
MIYIFILLDSQKKFFFKRFKVSVTETPTFQK